MSKKEFQISKKGRVFEKGVHVTGAEIYAIQLHLKNGKTVTEVSKEMKLDRRTVKKYSSTTIVNKGGRTKKHNTEVKEYLEILLQENSGLFLKEMQQKLSEDLRFDKAFQPFKKF
jgi:hypothetical protein